MADGGLISILSAAFIIFVLLAIPIFAEHLNEVSEYPPNSTYHLVLDPLDLLFARPEIRAVVAAFNPNTMGLEEKWVFKRDIMTYIKEVVELSSYKARKTKQPSGPLPSVACWLKDDDFKPWEAYMEPAFLTQMARTQTYFINAPQATVCIRYMAE
ncbi:hypothetical protein M408DRAFT_31020 [Serendipita vermifera MAFF 305830]|uniref:Uncharacterized protein n=1 Tax=Serendipita vermifera MAFF 305830 TaxID=933852 RepID=A0A0C2VZF8_SERVB|nr:hypothetical protein M408DRAFT_31020 [Serendipita vermifera MAFF 305830]